MNSTDFINELKASDLYTDGFEKTYAEFQYFQKLANDTLNEFHRVCEENGIPYQLAYGSLLGAIRDNGQIPWDYDIDVWVPYSAKDKLVRVLEKNLAAKYYFYCPDSDKKCRHFMMRLTPVGFKSEVLHVDVFYTVEVPKELKYREEFRKELLNLFNNRYYKLVKVDRESFWLSDIIRCYYMKAILGLKSVKSLDKMFKKLCEESLGFKSNLSVSIDSDIMKRTFQTDKLWDTKIIELPSGNYRISKNYDYILREIYNDYTKIFPLEDRLREMMRTYKNIKNSLR